MIERLYIQNFRCLDNLTLDFAGRPTALIIGKNGRGKINRWWSASDYFRKNLPGGRACWKAHFSQRFHRESHGSADAV